ncbi:unnamed protein product [Amoebophrya sp. A120]|nr:unnamed protein product [Amoebophrya sp. A120]|eukprot:GSA120T00007290001.1
MGLCLFREQESDARIEKLAEYRKKFAKVMLNENNLKQECSVFWIQMRAQQRQNFINRADILTCTQKFLDQIDAGEENTLSALDKLINLLPVENISFDMFRCYVREMMMILDLEMSNRLQQAILDRDALCAVVFDSGGSGGGASQGAMYTARRKIPKKRTNEDLRKQQRPSSGANEESNDPRREDDLRPEDEDDSSHRGDGPSNEDEESESVESDSNFFYPHYCYHARDKLNREAFNLEKFVPTNEGFAGEENFDFISASFQNSKEPWSITARTGQDDSAGMITGSRGASDGINMNYQEHQELHQQSVPPGLLYHNSNYSGPHSAAGAAAAASNYNNIAINHQATASSSPGFLPGHLLSSPPAFLTRTQRSSPSASNSEFSSPSPTPTPSYLIQGSKLNQNRAGSPLTRGGGSSPFILHGGAGTSSADGAPGAVTEQTKESSNSIEEMNLPSNNLMKFNYYHAAGVSSGASTATNTVPPAPPAQIIPGGQQEQKITAAQDVLVGPNRPTTNKKRSSPNTLHNLVPLHTPSPTKFVKKQTTRPSIQQTSVVVGTQQHPQQASSTLVPNVTANTTSSNSSPKLSFNGVQAVSPQSRLQKIKSPVISPKVNLDYEKTQEVKTSRLAQQVEQVLFQHQSGSAAGSAEDASSGDASSASSTFAAAKIVSGVAATSATGVDEMNTGSNKSEVLLSPNKENLPPPAPPVQATRSPMKFLVPAGSQAQTPVHPAGGSSGTTTSTSSSSTPSAEEQQVIEKIRQLMGKILLLEETASEMITSTESGDGGEAFSPFGNASVYSCFEEISQIQNMTVAVLRETKIGVFTQKYKTYQKNPKVEVLVRALRQRWTEVVRGSAPPDSSGFVQNGITPRVSTPASSIGSSSLLPPSFGNISEHVKMISVESAVEKGAGTTSTTTTTSSQKKITVEKMREQLLSTIGVGTKVFNSAGELESTNIRVVATTSKNAVNSKSKSKKKSNSKNTTTTTSSKTEFKLEMRNTTTTSSASTGEPQESQKSISPPIEFSLSDLQKVTKGLVKSENSKKQIDLPNLEKHVKLPEEENLVVCFSFGKAKGTLVLKLESSEACEYVCKALKTFGVEVE